MSRGKQVALVLAGLFAVALAAFLAYRSRPHPRPTYAPGPEVGLAWLPAEAAAVGAVNLEGVRQHSWFLETLRAAAGEVAEDEEYRTFVSATGFDYARDLDRLWLAVFVGDNNRALVAGVAEGRFDLGKITAYARRQGTTASRYHSLQTYEWSRPPLPGQPERRFAFTFLEDSHLAFAADAVHLTRVIDCWLGRARAVATDEKRRAELARLAAGQHAWAVLEPALWSPPAQSLPLGPPDFPATLTQVSLRLRISEQQAELAAEALCGEPRACERLRDNLRIMTLAARVALSRERDATARALSEALSNLSLEVRGGALEGRLTLAPDILADLLRAAPRTPVSR